MLVLSRRKNEKIIINGNITIVVADIRGDKVRLGIEAPNDIPVHRQEVQEAIDRKAKEAAAEDAEKAPAPEAVISPAEDRQQVADPTTAAATTTNTD